MSGEVVGWAMKQVTGSPTSKLVLVKLADNANEEGLCWPSMKKLVDHTELSERAVRKHLLVLEKMGLIFIERRNIDGVQLKNRFQLNLQYAVPLHAVPRVHTVQAMHRVQPEAAPGAAPPMHDVHAKKDNPQTEPSLNPHSHASVGSPEVEWPKVWAAFQTWPGLPVTVSERRARGMWEQLRHQMPADLVARILAHGVALARQNTLRGKAGPIMVPHPHNWLERDRGWEAYPTAADDAAKEDDARSAWGGAAGALVDLIGSAKFLAWFKDSQFDSGPPVQIGVPKVVQRNYIEANFAKSLRQLFGEFELKVAA
jgi:hypothetical protein